MCIDHNNTSHTLLDRALKLDDHEAWETLTSRYMTFVYHALKQFNLNGAECDDICQEVFVALTTKLKQYDKEKGKFRSWFSVLIKNLVLKYFRKESVRRKYIDKEGQYMNIVEAFEDSQVEEKIQEEWRSYLWQIAQDIVKNKYRRSSNVYDVFDLTAQGIGAEEIAERLGVSISTVYTLRTRVKDTLRNEFERIQLDLEW